MAPRPGLRLVETGGAPGTPAARAAFGPALEFAALGTGLTLVAVLLARLPGWIHDLRAFQSLYLLAFACYALTLLRLPRYASLPRVGGAVFVVALAARVALFAAPPSLSDDIYRYVWEGRVLLHGGNPWAQCPLDPALAPLRDARIFPAVNHPELATIYPPVAEAGFALVAALSPTIPAMKGWVIAHDMALVALLIALLRRHGRSPAWAVVYAWNPLVLVEYAGGGHNDPTAMVWLLVALAAQRARPMLSAAALGLGALVKLAPLVALPFLWRHWPWRARWLALGLLTAGLGAFAWASRGANSGLHAYWESWRNNALAFEALERWSGSFHTARALGLAAVCGVGALALGRGWSAIHGTRAILKSALLVSPVAHPWYQGWFLMLEPWAPTAPWILLSATAILSYGVFATPAAGRNYHLPLAWRVLEYGAPALLALTLAGAGALRGRDAARGGRGRAGEAADV
jgi:hypothetical protein